MKIVVADCDRCGKQKECVQVVVDELAGFVDDYEFTNVCEECVGSMVFLEEQF